MLKLSLVHCEDCFAVPHRLLVAVTVAAAASELAVTCQQLKIVSCQSWSMIQAGAWVLRHHSPAARPKGTLHAQELVPHSPGMGAVT